MEYTRIYFDLDGVLAAFHDGVETIAGFPLPEGNDTTGTRDDEMWEAVRSVPHFYDLLEPLPGTLDMFFEISDAYPGICEVLSAPPKPKREILTAEDDKRSWCARHLGESVPVNLVFSEDKPDFCFDDTCVLIDDRIKNIEAWEACGGIGILHTDPEDTLWQLGLR